MPSIGQWLTIVWLVGTPMGCEDKPQEPRRVAPVLSASARASAVERLAQLLRMARESEAKQRECAGRDAGPSSFPPLASSWGERAFACKRDEDCVLTALRDGDCCPRVCGTDHAYARSFRDALKGAVDATCPCAQCIEGLCKQPTVRHEAACQEQRCVAREVWRKDGKPLNVGRSPKCHPGDPLCSDI
jgi:hypothetical protein